VAAAFSVKLGDNGAGNNQTDEMRVKRADALKFRQVPATRLRAGGNLREAAAAAVPPAESPGVDPGGAARLPAGPRPVGPTFFIFINSGRAAGLRANSDSAIFRKLGFQFSLTLEKRKFKFCLKISVDW